MTRPDFREVAAARLKAERHERVSENVLRLLSVERAAPPRSEATTLDESARQVRLAGFDEWTERLRTEQQRFDRHARPVTLVVLELHGMNSLAAWFGQDAADRLIAPIADALRQNMRETDFLARIDQNRFAALLVETGEHEATGLVERMRLRCDTWLQAGALAVRVAAGWAEPMDGELLADALRRAEERMNADRRRGAR